MTAKRDPTTGAVPPIVVDLLTEAAAAFDLAEAAAAFDLAGLILGEPAALARVDMTAGPTTEAVPTTQVVLDLLTEAAAAYDVATVADCWAWLVLGDPAALARVVGVLADSEFQKATSPCESSGGVSGWRCT